MATGWKKDYFRYKDFFLNILSVYNTKPSLKIYLEFGLSITAILVFSVFAIKPTILTIIELNKEIKSKETTSLQLKLKLKDLKTANETIENSQDLIKLIDQSVPDQSAPNNLVIQLEELAIRNSLQILSISMSGTEIINKQASTKETGELPFVVTATGGYQNLINFNKDIENLRRPVKVDSTKISSSVTESGKIIIIAISGRVPFVTNNQI